MESQTNTIYACTYCLQKESSYLYNTEDIFGDEYRIHQCQNCNAIFLAPSPTSQQLARAYGDTYYGTNEDKFDAKTEKILNYFRRQRAKLALSLLPPNGHILDIGCGNGQFLSFVQQQQTQQNKTCQIHGIELPGKAAERAKKILNIDLKEGTLQEKHFEKSSLDLITMFHVFEHLSSPKQTLSIIQNILKKGGHLIISIPNIDSFQAHFFKGKWLHLDPPRHLFFFKPKDLEKELKNYGFRLVKKNFFSIEYNPFGMQQSLLNSLYNKREVLYEHLKGNRAYTSEYSKLNLLLQRLFYQLTFPLFIFTDMIESGLGKGATVQFVFKKEK